jgi:uncharacterized membrane protein YuzA (DUF378 family)
MGPADRLVRLLLAALIVGLFISDVITGAWGVALLVVAAVFTITGFAGTCPLYSLIRFSTRRS